MKSLRVCLDARLIRGERGGVEQATLGLVHGLSQLTDGDEAYYVLAYANRNEWLSPYLGGACRLLPGPPALRPSQRAAARQARSIVRRVWHQMSPLLGARSVPLPRSDGTIERAQVDLMHFTTQSGFLTDIPSIYQPWDLQHVHLPQLFTPRERLARNITYRAYCKQAALVAVPSQWGKRDLAAHFEIPADKVVVIPAAPALTAETQPTASDLHAVRSTYALPDQFIFYPAQTWAHKNHLGLLDALARLRDQRQLIIPLVCSGTCNDFYPTVERRLRQLHLDAQVNFLGHVSPIEIQCLYQLCRALIFPTRFEGFGLPLLEAFNAGAPVACSNATCLPEVAGDAAVFFAPDRTDQIAEAMAQVWTDEALRQRLIERGRRRVKDFSWERTARMFRAHYRRLTRRLLTEEDRHWIAVSDFVLPERA